MTGPGKQPHRRSGLAGNHSRALRTVLPDLPAGQEAALLHLILCPLCQTSALLHLHESIGGTETAYKPDYGPLWDRLDERLPQLLEQAGLRCAEAEELLAALLSYPAGQQGKVLQEPRFHSRFLLDLLLDRSGAAQPQDPRLSESLAALAAQLGVRLFRQDSEEEEAALCQARAANLAGNARRLLGKADAAEAALGTAAHFLAFTWGHSRESLSLCRYLGLLRWEQGRLEEAEGLLRQAARGFGELGLPCEEGASRGLLGLLSLERNQAGRAIRLLQASREALDPEARPWLTAQVGLNLALGLAESGRFDQARHVFAEAAALDRWVTAEADQVRLHWLRGRVHARLGHPEEAEPLLETARRRLIEKHSLPEATLCSLDLAVVLVATGRAAELPRLLRDIEETFSAEEALDVTRRVSRQFVEAVAGTARIPCGYLAEAAFTLRRVFRFRGYRIEPLPFA